MADMRHLVVVINLLLPLILLSCQDVSAKKTVLYAWQERIENNNSSDTDNPCGCSCKSHNNETLTNDDHDHQNGTHCGCNCCSCCATIKESYKIKKYATKHHDHSFLPASPFDDICNLLLNLYDEFTELSQLKDLAKDVDESILDITVSEKGKISMPKKTPSTSDPVTTTAVSSGLTDEEMVLLHNFSIALASYVTTWTRINLLKQFLNDTNDNTSTEVVCPIEGGNCSSTSWTKGCYECSPDTKLNLPCESPAPVCTLDSQAPCGGVCVQNGSGCPWNMDPVRIGCSENCFCCEDRICDPCPESFVEPLEDLLEQLDQVKFHIQITTAELVECVLRGDALDRANELTAMLEKLAEEMLIIIERIEALKRSSQSNFDSNRERLINITGYSPKPKGSLLRYSLGNDECGFESSTFMEVTESLKILLQSLSLSPTNADLQSEIRCKSYTAMRALFSLMSGSERLTKEQKEASKGMLDDMKGQIFPNVEENIKFIKEWNKARMQSLEAYKEKLIAKMEEISQTLGSFGYLD